MFHQQTLKSQANASKTSETGKKSQKAKSHPAGGEDLQGQPEAEQGGRVEEGEGAFQTMIFPHVSEEGEIGKELWRRSDQIAKRFLNRYDY